MLGKAAGTDGPDLAVDRACTRLDQVGGVRELVAVLVAWHSDEYPGAVQVGAAGADSGDACDRRPVALAQPGLVLTDVSTGPLRFA